MVPSQLTPPMELMELIQPTQPMEQNPRMVLTGPMEPMEQTVLMEPNHLMAPMVLTDQTAQMEQRMEPMVQMALTAVTPLMVLNPQTQLTLAMVLLNGMAHKLLLRIIPIILIILLAAVVVRPLNNN